jgi:hypothetical protein
MTEFKKFDGGKPMMSAVVPEFREGLAKVLTFGASKYGRNNWRTGTHYLRLLDSVHRHLAAFERGEDLDPESGLLHLYHAATNLMFISYYYEHSSVYSEFDDRVGARKEENS